MDSPDARSVEDHIRNIWAVADATSESAVDVATAASWRRSLTVHRIDPEKRRAPTILTEGELKDFRQPLDSLVALAASDLDELYAIIGDLRYVVLLADPAGVVVDHRGDSAEADQFKHWGIWRGAIWSEGIEGTNGIGSAIAELRPLTVHRAQHFRTRHISLSCSAAPIFDPEGRLTAILDVSSMDPDLSDRAHALALPLVARTAHAIEQLLFRNHFNRERIINLRAARGRRPALTLAVDADMRIVGADRTARQALNISDIDIKWGTVLPAYFEGAQALLGGRTSSGRGRLVARPGGAAWDVVVTPPAAPVPSPSPTVLPPEPSTAAALKQQGGLSPGAARRVRHHIDAHLAEPMRLETLADVAGLSVSYFARAFRITMEMTPGRYILQQRIARACDLLQSTDMPLLEIALRLGFADQSHFTRQFRRETGTTPSLMRKSR
jgi:AraC-like DNA-binding protein